MKYPHQTAEAKIKPRRIKNTIVLKLIIILIPFDIIRNLE